MKIFRILIIIIISAITIPCMAKGVLTGEICFKTPGGSVETHKLTMSGNGRVSLEKVEGVTVSGTSTNVGDGCCDIDLVINGDSTVYFNIAFDYISSELMHNDCEFYMPGFWYHRNERSPENAPSARISDYWNVREDRLSAPLTGVYSKTDGRFMTVLRLHDEDLTDCVVQNLSGDIILPGSTSVGFTGFGNNSDFSTLTFGFPYQETPKRYIRKLTLIEPVRAFVRLDPKKKLHLKWQVKEGVADSYAKFVSDVWNYSYDILHPVPLENCIDANHAKACLAEYFSQSYVNDYNLKYFSGEGLRTADCNSTGGYQVGFVGRVLLNAFNAIEYGRSNGRKDLEKKGMDILESVLKNGFTPEGYFIEAANLEHGSQDDFLSIRRQSEGVFAILNWLDYERRLGNHYPQWEKRITNILDKMIMLQERNGSFPRKFDGNHKHIDGSGGSTPSATLPMVMAYKYFKDKRYLESAKRSADYLESEIIDKSDYFSSTLDANCEDKEAALYASTAMYYLTKVTSGKERAHYMDLCREAAYFCLSWYYLWDVPFSQGQMLGDVGFKSRGWGNVSVENNHIDVFIFEFATILDKLADYYNETRFKEFSSVIKSSLLQLMPYKANTFDIAKAGYYPEVVQHTTWDYGRNGKGFYNDIFAPGWTVASLWQMLSPERVDKFFSKR